MTIVKITVEEDVMPEDRKIWIEWSDGRNQTAQVQKGYVLHSIVDMINKRLGEWV